MGELRSIDVLVDLVRGGNVESITIVDPLTDERREKWGWGILVYPSPREHFGPDFHLFEQEEVDSLVEAASDRRIPVERV